MKNVKHETKSASQRSCGSLKGGNKAPTYATLDVPMAYPQGAA